MGIRKPIRHASKRKTKTKDSHIQAKPAKIQLNPSSMIPEIIYGSFFILCTKLIDTSKITVNRTKLKVIKLASISSFVYNDQWDSRILEFKKKKRCKLVQTQC